jgi:hypothetical protein
MAIADEDERGIPCAVAAGAAGGGNQGRDFLGKEELAAAEFGMAGPFRSPPERFR